MAAAGTLPLGHMRCNTAAAEDDFATICLLKDFVTGFAVDDGDNFAAAVRALAGLAEYVGDVCGLLVHTLSWVKVTKNHSDTKEYRMGGRATPHTSFSRSGRGRSPFRPYIRHSWRQYVALRRAMHLPQRVRKCPCNGECTDPCEYGPFF